VGGEAPKDGFTRGFAEGFQDVGGRKLNVASADYVQ
jgi:hypothetical protein